MRGIVKEAPDNIRDIKEYMASGDWNAVAGYFMDSATANEAEQ